MRPLDRSAGKIGAPPPGGSPAEPFPRLGDYQLVKKLGEGGMAEIFLAKRFGASGFVKNVVIKRIRRELSHRSRFVSMFRDEARIAAKLDHPCIAQVMDFGEVDRACFICMEYVSGADLRAIVRRAAERGIALPVSAALRIAASVLEALEYAHGFAENGRPLHIVHRDVSPTNVMVSHSGSVKLLDFGIVKAASRATKTLMGELKGKTSYLAPEQVRGQRIDGRADLWGLGLTLFETLTGERLFATQASEQELMAAILEDPIPSPAAFRSDLPPEVVAIVLRALERDPGRRYRSAAAMRLDVEAALGSLAPGRGASELAQMMAALFDASESHLAAAVSELDVTRSLATTTPLPRPRLVASPAPEPEPEAAPEPEADAAPARRWPARVLAFSGAAALVALGLWATLRPRAPETLPSLAAVVPAPTPAPGPVAAPPVTAVVAPAAPSPPPPAAPAAEAPAPARSSPPAPPRPLSPREAGAAFGRARARILDCFTQHGESVAQPEGELMLSVVVAQSGAVREAAITSASVGSAALDRCIVERVKKIRFRKQPDEELRINVPFVYRATN